MKKYIKIFLLSSIALGLNSCNEDDLLDLKPINQISVDDSFSTPTLIASSINGMYNVAAIGQYNSTRRELMNQNLNNNGTEILGRWQSASNPG